MKSGIHILPARDECIESFQWLAQEVQQTKGEALIMRVERFEGLADSEIIELFRNARSQEYQEIENQAIELEKSISSGANVERSSFLEALEKLRKQHSEVARVDFFGCVDGQRLITTLNRLSQALSLSLSNVDVPREEIIKYQNKRWVTRPRPYIDRLACIWLIRRFINSNAEIRYSHEVAPDEVAFEMKDAQFGHCGNLCTFEVMAAAFGLDKPGIQPIAEIVHEIDLRDGQYARPETLGIDALLQGWFIANLSDAELETYGIKLFDGLYAVFAKQQG